MKRALSLIPLLFLCCGLNAQQLNTGTSSAGASSSPEVSAAIAIDTINTADKFVKIILFSDKSWEYLNLEKPVIDDDDIYDDWDTENIHMKGTPVDSLPDEIDILLVDAMNHYSMPLDTNKINSTYKYRGRRPHRGTDLQLSVGDTVKAAFDGIVRIAEFTRDTGGYGNLLVIRHPNGLETYYGHLSRHLVATGDLVKAGEPIGIGGSTGRSTGPHLHFETRYQGHAFDPERIFDFQAGVIRDSVFELHKQYFDIHSHFGQSHQEYAAAKATQYYKVRKGDTLGKIAGRYGTSISRLCSLNGLSRKSTLRVGRSLKVR
jgi:murein DD-endopeptidase MepM/ murein hydrolase activator NlpD